MELYPFRQNAVDTCSLAQSKVNGKIQHNLRLFRTAKATHNEHLSDKSP